MRAGKGTIIAASLAAAGASFLGACSEGYTPPSAEEQRITNQRTNDLIDQLGRGTLAAVITDSGSLDSGPVRIEFGGNTTTLPGRFGQEGIEGTITTRGSNEIDLPASSAGVPACLQGDIEPGANVVVAGVNNPDTTVTLETFSSDTGGDDDRYEACNIGDEPATMITMGLPDASEPFVEYFIDTHPNAEPYFPVDD